MTTERLNELQTHLMQQSWTSVYRAMTVDKKYNNLTYAVQSAMNEIMPKTTKTIRPYKPQIFWNKNIIQMRQDLINTQNKWTSSKNTEELQTYSQLKRTIRLGNKETKIRHALLGET